MKVKLRGYQVIQVTSMAVYAPTADAAEFTIDTVADVAGSLNGTYFHVFGADNDVIHTFWMDASSAQIQDVTFRPDVDSDMASRYWLLNSPPGFIDYYVWYSTEIPDVTDVTMRADSSSDMAGKYWFLNTPSTLPPTDANPGRPFAPNYYVWYSTEIAEVTDVTVRADVAGNLDGLHWLIDTPSGPNYYVWYNVDAGGNDPLIAGRIAIPVAISAGELINAVASLTNTEIDAISHFNSSVTTDTLTITHAAVGAVPDAVDGDVTGMTFNVTTAGIDVATDPAGQNGTTGKTGAKVIIVEDDTADDVGIATELVIEALAEFTSSESSGVITTNNVSVGSIIPHADGNIGGAFSVAAATTLGEDVAPNPRGFAPNAVLIQSRTAAKVIVAKDDTAAAVGTATELVIEALAEFTSSGTSPVTITQVNKGSVANHSDGSVKGVFSVAAASPIGVPVSNPAERIHGLGKNTTMSPVVILPGETADDVASQLRTEIAAESEFATGGATNQVTIINAADGEAEVPENGAKSVSTGFTFTITTPGVTAIPAAGSASINFFQIVGYILDGGGVQQGNDFTRLPFSRFDIDIIVPASQIIRIWEGPDV